MNNYQLTDQADRTAAITRHDESIFIDAGAGTGKTETIVRRIVSQIIESKDFSMENIAAITFTERAGAELRNRFRGVLLQEKADLSEAQKLRIDQVIASIDSAAIGTIHSFCKRLLTDHSIAANLPVGFQIGSESAGPRQRLLRARRMADLAFDNLSPVDQQLLLALDFPASAMQNLVIELDQKFAIANELQEPQEDQGESEAEKAVYRFIYDVINYLKADMQERRSSGEIEFDDLLIMTRDLLKSDSTLRQLVSDQYRVILVDEFQDTDPVQWQIVKLISQRSESDNTPKPGSLVLVGDPKQSIYRFRNADINTFISVKDSFAESESQKAQGFGSIRKLTNNFRTVTPVIEFVNWLFQDLDQGNPLEMGVSYKKLDPVHDPKDENAGPAVRIFQNPDELDSKGKPKHKVDTALECSWTAKEIRRAITQKYKVTMKGPDKSRVYRPEPATFGDVCILIPVRTQVGELIRALAANEVPFVSADPGIVFTRPLTSGLINALKVVAQTDDDMALWAALKSPLFALTDEQLYLYKSGPNSSWNIDGYAQGSEPLVQRAMEVFYDVRQKIGTQRPSLVLRELLAAQSIFEKLCAETDGAFEATALRMLIDHATQWENDGNTGLLEYIDALNILVDGKNKSLLPMPKEINQDAVQIMTIHASKGLEFPITVLTCMSNYPSYNKSKILISAEGVLEYNLGKSAEDVEIISAGYEDLRTGTEAVAERQEANRLLYVAMTRAQDHLVVSSLVSRIDSRSARIRDALVVLPPTAKPLFESVNHTHTVNECLPVKVEPPKSKADFRTDFDDELEKSRIRRVVSPASDGATDMKALSRAKVDDLDVSVLGAEVSLPQLDLEGSSEMIAALADRRPLGKALHGVMDMIMQLGEIPDQELLQSFLWEQAEKHGATAELASLAKRVSHLLKHEIVLEALSAEQRWPELHLAIADPDDEIRLAEGFADLVYKVGEDFVLVDYKTDEKVGVSQIMHYQQQLGAYALILEKLTGSLPARILLLHAEESGTSEIPIYLD
jgi:ATP-dependent helicase/nuclease subunit A